MRRRLDHNKHNPRVTTWTSKGFSYYLLHDDPSVSLGRFDTLFFLGKGGAPQSDGNCNVDPLFTGLPLALFFSLWDPGVRELFLLINVKGEFWEGMGRTFDC